MKLTLNKLTIRNFKGFKSYELEANGEDINVFGDNATGKTSLYDAFLWCLFGKNSADQATFDWKPLDKNGNEINHLETEVIAEIGVDGQEHKLSRTTSEKWTKKRGSAVELFDGHTTIYKINDLSVKKKEYEEYLSELIDEDLFKTLTSVQYFPEKLEWKDFRQGMLVCHQSFWASRILAQQHPYNLNYRFSADFDWCIRIMQHSACMHNSRLTLVDYLNEGMTTRNHRASLKERFRIMALHYGLFSTIVHHIWFVFRAILKR